MRKFLEWWLFFIVQLCGIAALFYYDLVHWIWDNDLTKISFIIFAIWLYHSLAIGRTTYLWCTGRTRAEHRLDTNWFFSDQCLAYGMIGTAIGVMIMLKSINLGDLMTPGKGQLVMDSISAGLGTSMINTAAGLIGSNLIKIQSFSVTRYMNSDEE